MARKAASHDQYRLVGTYERIRKTLLELPDDGRLNKALSFWVLPSDRRLPIAFLDRPLGELLAEPLEQLMSTPGVGQKKIMGFFDLLQRAAQAESQEEAFGWNPSEPAATENSTPKIGFDASAVSESLWSIWCDTVRRNEMGSQKLGRLAPSLRSLPTVIWHKPLSTYVDLSIAQMKQLRTHGEKRVNAILEIFCTVHEAISTSALHEHLDVELTPRFVPPLTRWLTEVVWEAELPPAETILERIVQPLVDQIDIDLGQPIAGLAAGRLCLDNNAPTVKQQAQVLGVTRARVYQLLEDCAKVMDVRWPEGRWLLAPLASKFGGASVETIGLLHGIRDLFYPDDRPAMHSPDELDSEELDSTAEGRTA